jgi:hypothetical protein
LLSTVTLCSHVTRQARARCANDPQRTAGNVPGCAELVGASRGRNRQILPDARRPSGIFETVDEIISVRTDFHANMARWDGACCAVGFSSWTWNLLLGSQSRHGQQAFSSFSVFPASISRPLATIEFITELNRSTAPQTVTAWTATSTMHQPCTLRGCHGNRPWQNANHPLYLDAAICPSFALSLSPSFPSWAHTHG